jgi:hypothetical protein
MENNAKMSCKDAFFHYGIQLPRRFTKKEKDFYLKACAKVYSDAGYKMTYTSRKIKGKNPANLFIGDPKSAKTILIANYDTPIHNFGNPYSYYPLNGKASFAASFLPSFTPLIISAVIVLYVFISYSKDFDFVNRPLFTLLCILICLVAASAGYLMSNSIGNSINMNRNTSGVAGSMMIAQNLSAAARKNVAIILSDDSCTAHGGDYLNRQIIEDIDKKEVILLNCIGSDDTTFIGCMPDGKKSAKNLQKYMSDAKVFETSAQDQKFSSFSFYPYGVCICRADEDNQSVKATGTKHDDHVDIEAVEKICDDLSRYLNEKYK